MKDTVKAYLLRRQDMRKQIDQIEKALRAIRERPGFSEGLWDSGVRDNRGEYAHDGPGSRGGQVREDALIYGILLAEKQKRRHILDKLEEGLASLEELERTILEHRYGKKWSMEKTAMTLGYERSWINKLELRAVRGLAKKMPVYVLRDLDVEFAAAGL